MNKTFAHPHVESGQEGFNPTQNPSLTEPYDRGLKFDGRHPSKRLSEERSILVMIIEDAFEDGALSVLSARQCACFTDVIISGDTYEVVARRYHISKSSVQSYVKNATRKIRQWIDKNND